MDGGFWAELGRFTYCSFSVELDGLVGLGLGLEFASSVSQLLRFWFRVGVQVEVPLGRATRSVGRLRNIPILRPIRKTGQCPARSHGIGSPLM